MACFVSRVGKGAAFSLRNALNSFSWLRGERLRTSSRPGERDAEVVLPTVALRYATASPGPEIFGGFFLFVLILFRSPSWVEKGSGGAASLLAAKRALIAAPSRRCRSLFTAVARSIVCILVCCCWVEPTGVGCEIPRLRMLGFAGDFDHPKRPPRFCGVVESRFIGPEILDVFTEIADRLWDASAP